MCILREEGILFGSIFFGLVYVIFEMGSWVGKFIFFSGLGFSYVSIS